MTTITKQKVTHSIILTEHPVLNKLNWTESSLWHWLTPNRYRL